MIRFSVLPPFYTYLGTGSVLQENDDDIHLAAMAKQLNSDRI
jgi:hypothetical protein